MFPAREYHRINALQKNWEMSQDDMYYAIENGLLQVCIWLPLRYVERIVVCNQKFVCECHEHQEGFVGVRPEDCRRICSKGRAKLRTFTSVCDDGHILRLAYEPPQPAICVRLNDLIVLNKHRLKFENSYDLKGQNLREIKAENKIPYFSASEDYKYIYMNEMEYHLGDVQARVIEQLHDASQSHQSWVHGKTLIYESGSQAVRLRDLFKNRRTWRGLIVSNERGYYRLNVPLEQLQEKPPDRSVERQQAAN